MRVLITGGGGFLAGHLLAQLQTISGIEAHSLTRAECDLARDTERLFSVLRVFQPARVFHLAGRINGSESELFRDNQLATRNLLEAVQRLAPAARVVLSSTAAVYGCGGSAEAPLSEDQSVAPRGHYATSKHACEQEAGVFARAGSWVVTARISNPVGPNMNTALLCGTLARQIVEIERGQSPILVLRDLSPQRDFISAGDCVRALTHMAEYGTSGAIYNVASGVTISVGKIVNTYLALARVRTIEVQCKPRRDERSSVQEQWISNERLLALGWRSAETVNQAISDQLEAERRRA
jgi:nucleoside-diphosphate-sugar epimerase